MVVLPAITTDIGGRWSHQHVTQKVNNRHALYQIITSLRYLCREGLSIRDMLCNSIGLMIVDAYRSFSDRLIVESQYFTYDSLYLGHEDYSSSSDEGYSQESSTDDKVPV